MKKKAPLYVLLSAALFATGGLFFKIATWNSLAISSARSLIAFVVISLFMIITKRKFVLNKTVIFAAIAMSCTNVLYSLSNKLTTAGNTIVLQFTMPIYVIIMSSIIHHKKPSRLELSTCFFVIFGIVLFFIDSLSAGNILGNILSLISGVSYAFYFVLNNNKDANPFSSIVISALLSCLVGLPELLKVDLTNTPKETFLAVFGLGLLQQSLAQIFLSMGIKDTPSITASLLSGLEPILNPILVAIFYGEMLTPLSLVGAAIVLVSIITYNVLTARKKETT